MGILGSVGSLNKGGMSSYSAKSGSGNYGSSGSMGGQKAGMFSDKNAKIQQKKAAVGQMNEFVDMLKQDTSILSVENKMGINAIGSIKVNKEFEESSFRLNPMGQLKATEWKLKIPDTFVKTADNRYVAPTETFTSYQRRSVNKKGKTRNEEQTGTYVPTEIVIDPVTGRLQKVIKRDVYENYFESEGRNRERQKAVYEKEVQDYSGGVLSTKKVFNPFTREKEKSTGKGRDTERQEVMLQAQYNYNPYGRVQESQHYGTYQSDGRDRSSAKFQTDAQVKARAEELSKSMYNTNFNSLSNNYAKQEQVLGSLKAEIQREKMNKPTTRKEKEYSTALKQMQYYDEWGRPIKSYDLW
jgi:hypothetical protein